MRRARNSRRSLGEIRLGQALWREGLRYRKNYPVYGTPDFAFPKYKLAVFCDGDFWHGRNMPLNPVWKEKIARVKENDLRVNRELRKIGWDVVRLWDNEIRNDIDFCFFRIKKIIKKAKIDPKINFIYYHPNLPVEVLSLPRKIESALLEENIDTVGKLYAIKMTDLKQIKNIGNRSNTFLTEVTAGYGIIQT